MRRRMPSPTTVPNTSSSYEPAEPTYDLNDLEAYNGVFCSESRKQEDINDLLNSNSESLKLDAMKKIITMIAKGKDASSFFPAVVKNVASKNVEVKKLVYIYLERYAEEQQELALLSISTFQRALKEPNQLIRAAALRVLSNIRVSVIAPIVLLAIQTAATDMSPYVRKTAAHAIPKLYSVDPQQKSNLVLAIQQLLEDDSVLVIGAAVIAFTNVCPERVDLIHSIYRKLCGLLMDVDEWDQVIIVNLLTKYSRLRFVDPNLQAQHSGSGEPHSVLLHPDYRLLLDSVIPLFSSCSAAVVTATANLYYHVAPKNELIAASKPLTRLLRFTPDIQKVVLKTIASVATENPKLFQPYLKSFLIFTTEPTTIKLLKLDILVNLVTDSNVPLIMQELRTYIKYNDQKFVLATTQAIGNCSSKIPETTNSCLKCLIDLLSNTNETVVAESVIVIKRLLQTESNISENVLKHMVQLLDRVTVEQARAAILWLVGEYSMDLSKTSLKVLAKTAKSFPDEKAIVKLQVLNLAVKLYINFPEETDKLCEYVFNLAKYDENYDIRDRARLLKNFVCSNNGKLTNQSSRIFFAKKPPPILQSHFENDERLQFGSLSHYLKYATTGYEALPPFASQNLTVALLSNDQNSQKTNRQEIKSKNSSEESYFSATTTSTNSLEEEEEQEEEISSSYDLTDENVCNFLQGPELNNDDEKSVILKEINTSEEASNLSLLVNLDNSTTIDTFVDDMLTTLETKPSVFTPVKEFELLDRLNGKGLNITYRFTRTPHLFSPSMVNINIVFTNTTSENINNIKLDKNLTKSSVEIQEFSCISVLGPNSSLSSTFGIDFNDSTQIANFQITSSIGSFNVSIKPSIGELLTPKLMTEDVFLTEKYKLRGMTEYSSKISSNEDVDVTMRVLRAANLTICPSTSNNIYRFAGNTLKSASPTLVTLVKENGEVYITTNCEKIVVGSILLNELIFALK